MPLDRPDAVVQQLLAFVTDVLPDRPSRSDA